MWQGLRELYALNRFFRAVWYQDLLLPNCMVPAGVFFPIQRPSLATDMVGSHVQSRRKSLGLTCSQSTTSTSSRLNSQAVAAGYSFCVVGAAGTEGWRGNKAMQRRLSHCRQTRRWVTAHHDHSYSKETKAGRALLVLDDVFSAGRKWWKMFKASFCLNLTWVYDDERKKPQNL